MILPNCDFCKHFHENVKDRMCCDAFPDGIPSEKIVWENRNSECARGVKYEDMNGKYTEFIPESDSILAKMHRI